MLPISSYIGQIASSLPLGAALQQLGHLQWQQSLRAGSKALKGQLCAGAGLTAAANALGQVRSISVGYLNGPPTKPDSYRTPPKNYVQLLQHIVRAKKVDALSSLVRRYGPKFDAVHVAAAFSVLPKLYRPIGPRTRITPPQLRKKRQRPIRLLSQLQLFANSQVPRMFAREVASITWSLGQLRGLLPDRGRDADTRQLIRSMSQRINEGDGRLLYQAATGAEVAKMLHGMALLGYKDSSVVVQLCRFIRNEPDRMHAKELAAAAWALARMRREHPMITAALNSISKKAVELKLYMRPTSICSMLTGFAHLNRRDEPLLAALTEEAYEQIKDFKASQLAILVWALGRLEYTPQPELVAAINSKCREKLEHFGSQELGLLLKGLRQLNGLDKQLLAEVAASISKEQRVATTPRDAARILAAFVAVPDAGSVKHVDGMAALMGEAITRKLCLVPAHVVTNLLVCYSKLPCHDPVVYVMLQEATNDTEGFFNLSNWASMMKSCKRLGLGTTAVTDQVVLDFYQAADNVLRKHLAPAATQQADTGEAATKPPTKRSFWRRVKVEQHHLEQQPAVKEIANSQFTHAVDIAELLGERGALAHNRPALSETTAVHLAEISAKKLPQMSLRQLIKVLAALLSTDKHATIQEVRQLVAASASRLQEPDYAQLPLQQLVQLTRIVNKAVSRNMLTGEQLLQRLYGQLMDSVDLLSEEQLVTVCDAMLRSENVHEDLLKRAEAIAQERGWKLPKQHEWQAFM